MRPRRVAEGMKRALMLVALILLSVCNATEYREGEARVIHVGGKVLCQDCTQGWNQWAFEGPPIKGCKVAFSCTDERKRVVYYASDETDDEGEYDISIDKHINGKEINADGCSVRLVSSPDPQCNILTDFAGGKSGVKLRQPSHVYRGENRYTLEPLFFTSPMCDEPDTSGDDQSEGSNY
ncbi:pistil-specific extensin-like protein [Aristolochia californica]|uniref:pistil-specific extensin-like protein n=1 Tax=Aristolochia californica TaxID=171875 RepID=UPI0035D62F8A